MQNSITVEVVVKDMPEIVKAYENVVAILETFQRQLEDITKRVDDLSNHLHTVANSAAGKPDARIVELMIKAALKEKE